MGTLQTIRNILSNYKNEHISAYHIYDKYVIVLRTDRSMDGRRDVRCIVYSSHFSLNMSECDFCPTRRTICYDCKADPNTLTSEILLSLLEQFVLLEDEQINIASNSYDVTYLDLLNNN